MVFPMGGRGIPGNKMPEPLDEDKKSKLDKYGTDLTKLAEEGKLDSVVGRRAEIECVIKTFGRMKRKNPCLIGEHGVGKTTIVHGLIQRIASGDVPETIKGKKVIALNINLLVADANFKRINERLKKLLEEIKERGDIILFLDDVHTIIGKRDREGELDGVPFMKPALERGNIKLFRDDVHTIIGKRDREGELDGVLFLKPALESGELKCIAATTPDEYKKLIETDPALEWQFQQVKVLEPTVDETILILEGQRERYEHHHKLRYTDEALAAAAHLSYRYISDSFLPQKAINLLDEVGSHVRVLHHSQPSEVKSRELDKELQKITEDYNEAIRGRNFQNATDLLTREKELKTRILALKEEGKERLIVKEMDIKHIISSWTGIPIGMIMNHDSDRLLKMEETLHKHIIGQEEVVKGISHAIIHAFMGMEDPRCRPVASFIFLGPTGNAKSEMASAVAASYFGSKEAMICLDMSDFMECHTALSLVGSPRGYVEGQLTAAVRKHPYTVVLFNEIEKAHACVLDAIQWILKTGSLTDGKGQAIDFRNTILIMTSNIGSNIIVEKSQCGYDQIKSLIIEELRKHFQPEFVDRLVELIIFRQPEEIHSAIIDVDSDINVAAQNGDATIVANDMLEMATGQNKRPHDREKNGHDA